MKPTIKKIALCSSLAIAAMSLAGCQSNIEKKTHLTSYELSALQTMAVCTNVADTGFIIEPYTSKVFNHFMTNIVAKKLQGHLDGLTINQYCTTALANGLYQVNTASYDPTSDAHNLDGIYGNYSQGVFNGYGNDQAVNMFLEFKLIGQKDIFYHGDRYGDKIQNDTSLDTRIRNQGFYLGMYLGMIRSYGLLLPSKDWIQEMHSGNVLTTREVYDVDPVDLSSKSDVNKYNKAIDKLFSNANV